MISRIFYTTRLSYLYGCSYVSVCSVLLLFPLQIISLPLDHFNIVIIRVATSSCFITFVSIIISTWPNVFQGFCWLFHETVQPLSPCNILLAHYSFCPLSMQ